MQNYFFLTQKTVTRKGSKDAIRRALILAKQRRFSQAIHEFTQTVGHVEPMDYLMLHTAAFISVKEFEACLCIMSTT